jgi:hypothetical protein
MARRVVVFNGAHDVPESTKPDGHEPTFGNATGCAYAAAENTAQTVKQDSTTGLVREQRSPKRFSLNPFVRPAS